MKKLFTSDLYAICCCQRFLDASTHLYKRLCPSVGWSIRPLVTTLKIGNLAIHPQPPPLPPPPPGQVGGGGGVGGRGGRIVVCPELVF